MKGRAHALRKGSGRTGRTSQTPVFSSPSAGSRLGHGLDNTAPSSTLPRYMDRARAIFVDLIGSAAA